MARATAGGDALVAVALALLSLLSRPSVAPTVRCVALRPSSCGVLVLVLVLALAPRKIRRGVDEGGAGK